ncbi:MAG TPA: amidohydrolase family protein [Opitutaceae bacterium]|jgi:cytosine/adenosine deaminase-related metal-dependent hydrolase
MPFIRDAVVLLGPGLEPWRCSRLEWDGGSIRAIDRVGPATSFEDGGIVVIPGLYNSHTHMGDSFLPDGATGMTLEQGFFRPDGFKYRSLKAVPREKHLPHVAKHLSYMARTGTVCHIDFREQGAYGSALLREASRMTGVHSVILGQFAEVPFDDAELAANSAPLPASARQELDAVLSVADGFSESTMNDLTDPAWREIRDLTGRRGKLRAIHCLENEGYRDVSVARTGMGDLARAISLYDPDLVVHMTVASSDEISLLAASGKTGVLNPRANANIGLPLPPLRDLIESGVNLLLGTDNGLLNSPNMFAELDFTYKLAKSQYGDAVRPDPLVILRMATTNARAALGGAHSGCVDVGLPATFVVLDFHQPHLRASRHIPASIVTRVTPEDVVGTFRNGTTLFAAERLSGYVFE